MYSTDQKNGSVIRTQLGFDVSIRKIFHEIYRKIMIFSILFITYTKRTAIVILSNPLFTTTAFKPLSDR